MVYTAATWYRRQPHGIDVTLFRGGCVASRRRGPNISMAQLEATGIFPPPSRDWPPLRAYSLLPHAIGPRYGHIPFSLMRLASATGIFPPPLTPGLAPRAHATDPTCEGSSFAYILIIFGSFLLIFCLSLAHLLLKLCLSLAHLLLIFC
eukprot:1188709-Prorocentrum_minimum.AAC.1